MPILDTITDSIENLFRRAKNNPLELRNVSGFPVSIGTSLALETLFTPIQEVIDPSRKVPDKIKLETYNLYIFNISTILRNLITSLPYKDIVDVPNYLFYETLLEEIEYLTTLFRMKELNISFYVNSYDYVKNTYKDNLRLAKSDQQKHILSINDYCLSKISREDDVHHFTNKISYGLNTTALILTHVPWDLLSHDKFHKLDLLESHTGIVKTRKDWNTKYFKLLDYDMSFLPFYEYLLTTFGDNIMFKPDSLEKRKEVYNNLKKLRVHPLMSEVALGYTLFKK